jgi:fatty-acyl-CoA synthase
VTSWALRTVAPELVERYRSAGWWTDEALGEVVHVFLVTEGPDVDVDRIRDSVVAELGALYQPRGVTIVPRLPLTKVGKVDKRKLRAQFR